MQLSLYLCILRLNFYFIHFLIYMVVDELTSTIVEKTTLNSHSKHGWIDDPSKSTFR